MRPDIVSSPTASCASAVRGLGLAKFCYALGLGRIGRRRSYAAEQKGRCVASLSIMRAPERVICVIATVMNIPQVVALFRDGSGKTTIAARLAQHLAVADRLLAVNLDAQRPFLPHGFHQEVEGDVNTPI